MEIKNAKINVIPASIDYISDDDTIKSDALDAIRYCYNDILTTQRYCYGLRANNPYAIEKVIFHDPATIIYWVNGDKTVVKCSEDDVYDREKGLAMAICKYALGDNFKKVFKEWVPEEEVEMMTLFADGISFSNLFKNVRLFDVNEINKKD